MSINRRIAFGAAASWFSRGVTILLGLVLMPILFRHLPKEELGIWLLLGQSWAALGILDLGFGVTLTRRIAFAKGKSGGDPNAPLTDETLREIADLVATGRHIYHILSFAAFAISFSTGYFYLKGLNLHGLSLPTVWLAWGVLCLSQAFGVWAAVWTCLLQGVGYVGWDAVLGSCVNAITLTVQIIVALCGGGLVGLAVTAAGGALLQRFLVLGFARRRRPELFSITGYWQPALLRSIAPVALRAWLTALGIVLALQTDQFFIASFKGAAEIPAYRAAYVVLVNLNTLGITFAGASGVFISHLWQARQFWEIHRILQRNLRLGLGLIACGGMTLTALGSDFFDLWLGRGNFIGYPILLTFFALQFLEAQAYIISNSSRATEDEAFALWSIAGGCVKIALSFLLAKPLGLLGIALASFLSLLLTNHWFMAWRGLHRLDFGLKRHLRRILGWVALLAVLTFGSVAGAKWLLAGQTHLVRVLVCIAVAGCLLALYLWLLVLDASERARISGWCNRRFKEQTV